MNKSDVSYKFTQDAKPVAYYGNTVISFLNEEDNPVYQAAKHVQEQMMQTGFSKQAAFVPADSFHATVLNLCREIDREDESWPTGVSRSARFREIDEEIHRRVESVPMMEPVMLEIDQCMVNSIRLKTVSQEDEQRIQEYRRALSQATGIRHEWHDTFRFHITLNYILRPFSDEEQTEADEFCAHWTKWLKEKVKPFVLPEPKFVIFNDMMSYTSNLDARGNLY